MTLIIIQTSGHHHDGITHLVRVIAEGIAHDPGDFHPRRWRARRASGAGTVWVFAACLVVEQRPTPRLFQRGDDRDARDGVALVAAVTRYPAPRRKRGRILLGEPLIMAAARSGLAQKDDVASRAVRDHGIFHRVALLFAAVAGRLPVGILRSRNRPLGRVQQEDEVRAGGLQVVQRRRPAGG